MQSIVSCIVGVLLAALVFGFCWVWFLGPLVRSSLAVCNGCFKSLGGTFNLGVSIGNKVIKTKVEKVIEADGEVVPEAQFFDAISAPNYEVAKWVESHPIKKIGYVQFRGYSNHLERSLVLENKPTVEKKLGKRIQLPNLEGSFLQNDLKALDKTILEVNELVESTVSKVESKSPVAPKVAVAPVTAAALAVAVTKEPALQASPVETSVPEVKKDKAIEAYKGFLISYGKAVRHMSSAKNDDGKEDAGKEIEQFRIVIRSEDGVDESIWGQDLLRAIKDANISLNEKIEVIKTGKRQFGSVWKNLYVINKVA